MTGFLTTEPFLDEYGGALDAITAGCGLTLEPILIPRDPADRVAAEALPSIEIAYFSGDLIPDHGRSFFAAAQGAPNLRWLQAFNAGTDNPVFQRLLDRGVTLSTSSGSSAEPIAQTVIAGMLMLARGFVPHYRLAQDRREWTRLDYTPRDLGEQTMTVVGLGAIGNSIARIAAAIGLHVIGVRRSPAREGDHAHEIIPTAELPSVLPRTDWLVLACPLTDETRGLIDARAIAALPPCASIINIARGAVIDEPAMIAALQTGHLGGAYLDVFETEPLPPESPFWAMPNVIVTPHNSSVSTGNAGRSVEIFFENLGRWARSETLRNQVTPGA